jgi:hypothetical protein
MGQTFVQLLPFLIAGAFLPTWTSYVIILLGTDRPFGNAGGYVAGNATWRLILGVIAIFVATIAAPTVRSNKIVMPVWFALSLAAILIGIGVYLIRKKPKTETQETPKWLKELKRLPPWASFGYGMWSCMLPGAQWVYFLGGCAVIATSGLNSVEQFTMLLIFIALLEVMLVTPIVIYARRRERAKATFDRLDLWLGQHASTFFGVILSAIGLLFVWIALNGGKVG